MRLSCGSSFAVASATSRFPCSSARPKIEYGRPCEVDAPPPRGRDGLGNNGIEAGLGLPPRRGFFRRRPRYESDACELRAVTPATRILIASSLEKPAACRAFFLAARYSASCRTSSSEKLVTASAT